MFIIVDTKDLEELKIPLPPDGSVTYRLYTKYFYNCR